MAIEISKSAEQILEFLGDEENILSIGNCMTRLRVNLKDKKKVDVGLFKKVDGVLGVVETKEQLQIIIEPKKARILVNEFNKVYKIKG